MPKRRVPRHEGAAREATLLTLMDARDQLKPGSIERIFLDHAADHCFEVWLSETYGCPVRIVRWTGYGVELEYGG